MPASAPTDTLARADRPAPGSHSWREVLRVGSVFLRIGATAFGGPAAHIAIMRHELVERRRWLSEQHFLDLLGATNLIPGPNSSEMTMHIGYLRAGLAGLLAGGIAFVLPGMVITLILAWVYTRYGTTPAANWLLYGITPVIIPLIVAALWSLGRRAITGALTALVGVLALTLYYLGVNFVIVLITGGLMVALGRRLRQGRALLPLPLLGMGLPVSAGGSGFSLLALAWTFFKIGALLYGSGYVLFAFMHAELVERHAWLTEQALIDAIAAGQMTPGPLSTTATFVGYLLAGVPGAIIATAAFYLPALVIVALSNPLIPRIRASTAVSSLLDGVNVAALGLMAAVTWELARAAFVDVYAILLAGVAALLLWRFKVSAATLVILGAAGGLLSALL
ncbi:MAG: chromate transporter [Anaerolineae bacterium]|nr:MAG: chromate transporter [Anaerolineae bacterium]